MRLLPGFGGAVEILAPASAPPVTSETRGTIGASGLFPGVPLVVCVAAFNLVGSSGRSPEETARDGKTFVTTEEYNRMAETIMRSRRSNDEKRLALENLGDRYWILVGEDIRRSYVADMAARARKRIEYINGVFEKRMKKKGGSPTPATEKKSDAEESPKPVAAAKSKPPSSATPSDKQNPVESGKIVMDEQRQQIQRAMFG